MAKHTYYYHSDTDDVVNSHDQSYSLPDDYTILPTSLGAKIWSPIVRVIATILSWLYSRLIIHIHIIGKEKVKKVKDQGYFIYGNHTRPVGDVFTPLIIFPILNFYAIAAQANWGIPFIGKFVMPYAGLPVGHDIKQSLKLIQAIKTVINKKKGVVLIYPEAHVWPYYTKIRPFDPTSMHFPVALNAPSFTMTTTYHKPRFGKRPKIVIYIDGPFYPDLHLNGKKAQIKLHDQIWDTVNKRAKLSNYQYYNYKQK